MKRYYIGIDSGSTMCKSVLFDGKNIVDYFINKTGWNAKQSAEESFDYLLRKNSLFSCDAYVTSTGYGRETIDFADCTFTEITCHAVGANFLSDNIGGVIDIGGQDSKVIQIQNGKVVNFLMNDKCAAGTGRFLSMACDTLGINIDAIDEFVDISDPININSMCTVFAESEIIGLLSMQRDRRKILAGVLHSIAQKIRQMTSKLDFSKEKPLLITGGLSRSNVLRDILSKTVGIKVLSHEYAIYAGAVGACICSLNRRSAG